MIRFGRITVAVFVGVMLLAGSGCVTVDTKQYSDNPTRLDALLVASGDLNPDFEGRPSPVIVRIYELVSPSVFDSADFFALYENDKGTLGQDLARVEEMEVVPGESKPVQRDLKPETRYIGVLVAYRDIEKAGWRASVAVPYQQTRAVTVDLQRLSVSIQPRP